MVFFQIECPGREILKCLLTKWPRSLKSRALYSCKNNSVQCAEHFSARNPGKSKKITEVSRRLAQQNIPLDVTIPEA
jgi:hypothetical protein